MAKKRRAQAIAIRHPFHSAPTVEMTPRRGRVHYVSRRVGGAVRAVGRRARGVAKKHGLAALPVTGIALGGLMVGYADSKGYFNRLPAIGNSRALTLGLLGYAATRFVKNPTIRLAGIAAIAAASFDYGKVHGGKAIAPAAAPHGIDEAVGAHDDESRFPGDGGPY